MGTKVLLSIDTELTWRHHSAGLDWEENYARSVEPAGVGLSYQLQKLADHGIKACFFVDPMPAVLFGADPIKRMVETVLEGGQEVQLHLHPMWTGAIQGGGCSPETEFELCNYDLDRQIQLIAQARELLMAVGAPKPLAFRSGSYAADDNTMRALKTLDIPYDCSHNGSEAPWPSAMSLSTHDAGPVAHEGVVVLPVSQINQSWGGLRHVQICALSFNEIRRALEFAIVHRQPVFTIVSHSFELATRNGLKPNLIVRRRFDHLCRLLQRWQDVSPTMHFNDLEGLDLDTGTGPSPASPFLAGERILAQSVANLIERVA